MGIQISFIVNSVYELVLNQISGKIIKHAENAYSEIEIKAVNKVKHKQKQHCVIIALGSEKHEYSISLEKLVDNCYFFNKKSTLNILKENENYVVFPHISQDSYKTLLKVVIEGQLIKVFNNFYKFVFLNFIKF